MKKLIVFACLATTISMTAGVAMADSIKGRIGVTGKLGFILPADNDADLTHNKTDVGLTAGAGLIYGLDNHFAAEIGVTQSNFDADNGDFDVTDFSLGGQYRFTSTNPKLVPYLGAGFNILATDYNSNNGGSRDVDTKFGVYASGGVDYFLLNNMALTAEVRLVVAPDAKITDGNGNSRGHFDPTSFSTTGGIKFFFN